MQSQIRDEEDKELLNEIKMDTRKAFAFPDTVIGRARFRSIRVLFHELGIDISVPHRDAIFSHNYCKKYSAIQESDDWRYEIIRESKSGRQA